MASLVAAGTLTIALRRSGTWQRLGAWGADPALAAGTLPGDELVVDPFAVDTRTLEIDAPPAAIWPWFVQMGDDRGGEYSYSLFGFPHRKGADRIVPEWQDLAVGDRINQWVVRELEPERALSSTTTSVEAGAGYSSSSQRGIAAALASSSASGLAQPSRDTSARRSCACSGSECS